MRNLTKLLALACAFLVVGACSTTTTPTAVMDYDPSYNFSGVRKIAIQPFDRSSPASVTISDMQVERIDAAITVELQRRGFTVVADNDQADMFLTWHLVTQERTDVRSFNTASRYSCWSCPAGSRVSVQQYSQGTFIVDMIDPQSLRSVWRSTMQSRMRAQPDPQAAAENRRVAAEIIFAEFPPR